MSFQLSPAELAAKLQSPQPPHLLDVRNPEEFEYVALPGATLIPLGELSLRAEEIEAWKDEEIVVYCHHGIRSLHAIGMLRPLGFSKLLNLSGGIDRWTDEVDPKLPRY